jgi:hypothetical protein
MSAVYRSAVYDNTNIGLDLWVTLENVLVDVVSLSWQIFDISTDLKKTTPVQVFPVTVGNKQTAELTSVPTGDKISTGRYLARWTVPTALGLGTHEIRWFYKRVTGDTEQVFSEEFEVVLPPDSVTFPSAMPDYTVRTFIDLVDGRGVPVKDQYVRLYPINDPLVVYGYHVGLTAAPVEMKTDGSGHAEANVVKGLKCRVVIADRPGGPSYVDGKREGHL